MRVLLVAATAAALAPPALKTARRTIATNAAVDFVPEKARPLSVAIAGGGVGGLTTALTLLKAGHDVTIYEKTQAFARFGGPIQFASNALSRSRPSTKNFLRESWTPLRLLAREGAASRTV